MYFSLKNNWVEFRKRAAKVFFAIYENISDGTRGDENILRMNF